MMGALISNCKKSEDYKVFKAEGNCRKQAQMLRYLRLDSKKHVMGYVARFQMRTHS